VIDDLTEKQWQAQVVQLARTLGWHRPMHIYDSRRTEPGWPDLALVRDRFLLLELKTETGRLTNPQRNWIGRLHKANVEVYVVRPRHFQQLATILQARGPQNTWNAEQHEARGWLMLELGPILYDPSTAQIPY
jgi:hypothetical protein